MTDLLLRGGRPLGGDQVDLLLRAGVIAEAAPALDQDGAEVIDLAGQLVLPGLIDSHTHLDKTLFGGPWVPHSAGDPLAERIANERRRRGELGLPDVEHITALLRRMIVSGTTHVRSHTDVYSDVGLEGVEAVAAAAGALTGRITVEQVAFPQHGILSEPGTAALLEDALKAGVRTIGGIDPAGIDRDPVRHLDIVFDLATRYGAGVDIHLHDGGSLGEWELELIAERTAATGLAGKVAVSHAYALGQAAPARQDQLAERLAAAGVAIITAAVYDFPVPPIKKLLAAGVTVASGHDGIRDLWGPYGSGDMLERVMHVAYRSTFRRDDDINLALATATTGAATALGLAPPSITQGAAADLVVVDAQTVAEAVVTRPARSLVVKAGRVVARDGALAN
jgi:cytosine/creatinine deaminase